MPIYVLLVWGFFTLDFYEAHFKALLGEILVFSPFSRLYGLLDGFLSRIWSYFFLNGLLPLTQRPLRLGPLLRWDLGGSA